MLNRRQFLTAAALAPSSAPDYLSYVRKFANTLLAKGLDVYGPRRSPLWAGVIDAETMTVPDGSAKISPPEGVRPSDRALGGCNPYHDAVAWRAFRVLGAITGEPRYSRAVDDYIRFFLANAQNPKTGFLGWGEHLYYDFFRDEVAAERRSHELLEWTPPWPELWAADSAATTKAIAALRYHFYYDDPSSLFNRHAWWDRPEHQKPGGQPWIKHTGLYAYSFLFLYSKTHDPLWFRWGRGVADLYWNRRDPLTNLTLGCIDDPRPTSRYASPQMPELAYWLFKAWQTAPAEKDLRTRALTYLRAFNRYFYDARSGSFWTEVAVDGKRISDNSMRAWNIAYGEAGLLSIGRIAAYIGRIDKNAALVAMAHAVAEIARRTPLPEKVSQQCLAFALNLSLDLFDQTRSPDRLAEARSYADAAIERFWYPKDGGGLFVRAPGDRYYEAKVATGDLLAGLLRLHLRLNPKTADPGLYDWSY